MRRVIALAVFGVILGSCWRGGGQPNVLIITIDTLRADRIGAYGYGLARTPNMDRLAAEGVRVDDAIAVAPITLPSHASIMTGLYPPAHGVRDNGTYALADEAVTLAERLKAAGYRTQAFVSALVLNRRYNLAQGFDGYDDDLWAEDQARLFMIRKRPGPKTAERVARWLDGWAQESPRRPFFVWMHLFDPHQPYTSPVPERALFASPYDADVALADRAVGRVLEALRHHGVLDRTLIVLTADHGESLGEHGEKTHGVFIYDATVHVPLIFRDPARLPRGRVYPGPVRSVDIVPTVLAALGLPGGDETQGTNLLDALRGREAPPPLPQYSESLLSEVGFGMAPLMGVRMDGHKWIRAPRPELYDLKGDPRELTNLAAKRPDVAARLDQELTAIVEDSRRRALASPRNPMDRETAEMLRGLGYLARPAERAAVTGMDPKDAMPVYALMEDARHLAQRNRWREAERLLRQVLVKTPNNVSALNTLALVRMRQGDVKGAHEEYLKSLAIDPSQSRVFVMLGSIAMIENDFDLARKHLQRALEITPGFVEAMANLGIIEALRNDLDEAERWYRKAIEADPEYPRAYRRLADVYYERGQFAKALEYYQRTLAARPNDFATIIQAGNSARRAGEALAAAEFLTRAQRLRPDSWIPVYNLACLRAAEGDAEGSLHLLQTLPSKGFRRIRFADSDPDLEAVRRLPGYQSFVQAVRQAAPTSR